MATAMAPSWAQALVMAAPIPFAPPVTSTTLSLSCRSMIWRWWRRPVHVPKFGSISQAIKKTLAAKVQETSVNRVVRTRDERRFVRAKKQSKGGNLLRLSHSPDGLRFFQPLKHLLFFAGIITAQKTIDKRGMDPCRRNAMAANVVGEVILRHRICHCDNGTLTHGVSKPIREACRPSDGRHIQNDATSV